MNPLKLGAAPAPSTTMGQASLLPHYGRGRSCYWCCHYLIQGSSVTGGAAPAPWRQNGQNGWPFWCREPVPLLFPCKPIDWTAVFSIASSGTGSSQPIPGTDPFQCQEPGAPHCSCCSMWLDNCVLFARSPPPFLDALFLCFRRFIFRLVTFGWVTFERVVFERVTLGHVTLGYFTLWRVTFERVKFRGVTFVWVTFEQVTFGRIRLRPYRMADWRRP